MGRCEKCVITINFRAVAVAWVLQMLLLEILTEFFLRNLSFEGQLGVIL